MSAAIPTQFAYTYESRMQSERPANNATYMTPVTRDDPNFRWQNSGQRTTRGQTVWVRATRRRMTPEYKAFLAAEKASREAQLDMLSGLLGTMSMSPPGSNGRGNYAASLISGMTANQRKNAEEKAKKQAAQLKAEINELTAMMGSTGMEGGKKRRHTKRRSHTKRRHTRRH